MICIPHQMFFRWSNQHETSGECCTYEERRATYRVLVGKPEERGHLENLGTDGRILKWISKKRDGGLIRLRRGTGSGFL